MGEIALKEKVQFGDAVEAWHRLQRVYQLIYRELQKRFADKGITTAQFEVLMELMKYRELPMCRIGDLLSVTGGNVTGLIDRLEKKGLVERTRSEKDRRIVMARITRKGDRVFRRVSGEFEEHIETTLSGLANGDLTDLNQMLEKLQGELNEQLESDIN